MKMSRRAKRMDRHHKRNKGRAVLNLVSLMDIFTILVFFLLVNSGEVQVLPNAKALVLPESKAIQEPKETLAVMVNRDEILVQVDRSGAPPFLLILDLLQDVHNLGSLLRTAEAVGIHGAVIQRRRAAEITPTVVNTSAGAVEHLHIAQVSNIANTISALQESQIWVYGLEAARGAQRYDRVDLKGPLALVVGSEGQGLRRLVRERCDLLIEMPMLGKITSLNAAVAGSILLYEALRQRMPDT